MKERRSRKKKCIVGENSDMKRTHKGDQKDKHQLVDQKGMKQVLK